MEENLEEKILQEYLILAEMPSSSDEYSEDVVRKFFIKTIGIARQEEPRITTGQHFYDWINIVDDDDTMDSYYGEDYFNKN